ncbi:chemotaxis response regulator protein-glutamate methylesterase [Clostridium sp.]|uniref:chemotaxis response regulator protein-glutamate methylesterase n=1 Tax=Clostridium sp. TaxID=1506 RepID=UPI0034643833
MQKIRVLVVDDSALMRRIISDMINEEKDMEVIDVARNGEELLNKVEKLNPQVITLDVEMPKINGVRALKELKKRNLNIPVIMLSSLTKEGTFVTMECLEAGAFEFISKPSGSISLDINKVKSELVEKIRQGAKKAKRDSIDIKDRNLSPVLRKKNMNHNIEAMVIGASTGGPRALTTLITNLPKNLGFPILVVQHMPVGFTHAFAERLNANSKVRVVEADNNMIIEKDTVYIAKGGFHMEVTRDKKIRLTEEPPVFGVRPCVDKLFISAAKVYREKLMSIVLTGMGRDGANGSTEVKALGGTTISEHESTCTIYGMPKVAFETGNIDEVLPLGQILSKIIKCSMVK